MRVRISSYENIVYMARSVRQCPSREDVYTTGKSAGLSIDWTQN